MDAQAYQVEVTIKRTLEITFSKEIETTGDLLEQIISYYDDGAARTGKVVLIDGSWEVNFGSWDDEVTYEIKETKYELR